MPVDRFQQTLRRVVLIQVALIAVAAVISILEKGFEFTWALLYGGAVAIAGTLVSAWRLRTATEPSETGLDVAGVFQSTILKYVLVVGLLAVGLGVLKLTPLAVVIGVLLPQLGFLFGRGYAPRRRG